MATYPPQTATAMYTQAGSQPVERSLPLMQEQIERLEAHAKDLDMMSDRLHSLADRICGSRPEGVVNQANPPQPSHALAQMNEIHGRIERSRERLQDAINRLERL